MNLASESIVAGLLRASIGLSMAALSVAVCVRLLRLREPRAEQWAWLIVLAQGVMLLAQGVMLLPVSIPVPVGFWGTAAGPELGQAGAAIAFAAPRAAAEAGDSVAGRDVGPKPRYLGSSTVEPPAVPVVKLRLSNALAFSWPFVALAAWLAGVVILVGLELLRYRSFTASLHASWPAPPGWQADWEKIVGAQSIRTRIDLVVTRDVGPALCRLPSGYRIVVPELLWAGLEPGERTAILRHELAHFQRGDLWTALLARGLAVIHWFNPVAWWAAERVQAQSEFICDRAPSIDDREAFAAILLRLGSGPRTRVATVQSAGSGNLYERIMRLLIDSTRPARWKSALLIAVAVLPLGPSSVRLRAIAMSDSVAQKDSSPVRALVRVGAGDLRTLEFIMAVALSPDGKLVAAATAGNAAFPGITLFEVKTGKQVKVLSRRDRRGGGITRVAFSPDGSELLSGELNGWVTLWDLTTDRELFHERLHGGAGVVNNVVVDLAAYTGTVTDVAFSPDGSLIATSGVDSVVHLRRADKPKEAVRNFKTPFSQSRQPARLAAGGGPLPEPEPGFESARGVTFTRDGAMLIVGSDTAISIFRIKDGLLVRQIDRAHGGREGATDSNMESLAVTPDGRRIVSAGHSTVPVAQTRFKDLPNVIAVTLAEVRMWNFATGEPVMDLEREEHRGLGYASLSQDGRRVAVSDLEGIRILETETGKPVLSIAWPDSGGVRPAFSPDGTIVATASGTTVGLFDARTGRRLHHVDSTPAAETRSAAWSPSGDRVVTGHGDGIIRVWEAGSGELIWSKPLSTARTPLGQTLVPNFVAFSRDGRRTIAAGGRDMDNGLVAIYEAGRGLQVRTVALPEVTLAALSPNRQTLVVAASHKEARGNDISRLYGIDVETGQTLWATPADGARTGAFFQIRAIQFRPDSLSLDLAQCNGNVIHFDALTGKEERRFKADWRPIAEQKADRPFTTPQVLWLGAFSSDNRTLTASANEFVYVWDVETGKLRRSIRRSHKWGSYLAVAPDGKTLATSDHRSADDYGADTIRLYDLDTGLEVLTLNPVDDRAVVLAFSPDGTKLFSGFHRGSAIVWDVRR